MNYSLVMPVGVSSIPSFFQAINKTVACLLPVSCGSDLSETCIASYADISEAAAKFGLFVREGCNSTSGFTKTLLLCGSTDSNNHKAEYSNGRLWYDPDADNEEMWSDFADKLCDLDVFYTAVFPIVAVVVLLGLCTAAYFCCQDRSTCCVRRSTREAMDSPSEAGPGSSLLSPA